MNRHVAADDNDEMDLVDQNDRVIGTINQADADGLLQTKAGLVRGVAAFVQNDEGKLWIPTRATYKRVAPGGLDFSVAEHVQKGETYDQAIVRGFKEELLLDVSADDLVQLGKLQNMPVLPYFFMETYVYKASDVSDYNHADYTGYEWLDPAEVVRKITSGTPAKSTVKVAIEKYLIE